MNKYLNLLLVCFIAGTFGCSNSSNNLEKFDVDEMETIYTGTYTWTNLTRDWSRSSTPVIQLKNGKYTYKGLSNDSYYNSGSGNFSINGNVIKFELTYYDIPMEDIGVVNAWLLNGEYECKLDGDKLSFSKTATVYDDKFKYEFELKRKR